MVRNDRSDTRLETEEGKDFFHVMLDKIEHPEGPHRATEEEMYQLRAIIYRYIHACEIACDTLGVFKALCGDAHLLVHFCEVGQDEEFKERQPHISALAKEELHQNREIAHGEEEKKVQPFQNGELRRDDEDKKDLQLTPKV